MEDAQFALAGSRHLSWTGRPARVEAARFVRVRLEWCVLNRAAREASHQDTYMGGRGERDLNAELE